MSDYALHPEAFADIDEIWEYIASDSVDAADRAIEPIFENIARLAATPQQGHPARISHPPALVLARV